MFVSGEPFSSLLEGFPLNKHQERMLLELLLLTVLVNAVLLSTSTVLGQTSLRRRSRCCELAATGDEGVRLSQKLKSLRCRFKTIGCISLDARHLL